MTIPPGTPQSTRKTDAGRVPGPAEVAGVIELKLWWTQRNGKLTSCAFHAHNSGGFSPSVGEANTLFASIGGAWTTNLALYSPTTTNLLRLDLRDMTLKTNPVFSSTSAAVAGTSASNAMPEEVALVLTHNIAGRGRGLKGRSYIPNWAVNADTTAGTADPLVQTAMNAWGTQLFSIISSAGTTPCVASPARLEYIGVTGTLHAARPQGFIPVSSYTCRDTQWDSQRRREQL